MGEYAVYIFTFMAVIIPTILYCMSDKSVKVAKSPKRSAEVELPTALQIAEPFTNVLERLGLGGFLCRIFRSGAAALEKKIEFSGLKTNAKKVYCAQVFLAAVLSVLFAGMAFAAAEEEAYAAVGAALGFFVGWFSPRTGIDNIVDKKRTAILRSLPYSIDLIGSAMRGGLDFMAAVRFYVNLSDAGPLRDEFLRMLHEMELGVTRISALRNMALRVQIKEFTSFVSAIELGTELGSPLTETMEIQGEEMRKARFALAECKAQRAPSLMLLPMAIFIMPAVFIIILTPIYIRMKEAGVSLF